MRAVITGGAGFLGSHLCDAMLLRGWEVLCIDNLITGQEANIAHIISDPKFGPKFSMQWHDVTKHIDVPALLKRCFILRHRQVRWII
jgi:dTDP-glucose 4,6-dehydratase